MSNMEYDFEELNEDSDTPCFTDLFTPIKVLGKGSFGIVVLATYKNKDIQYAVKVVPKKYLRTDIFSSLVDEGSILNKLKHPNVIKLIDIIQTKTKLMIVMEWIQGGTLADFIKLRKSEQNKIMEDEAAMIMKGLLHGIEYFHSKDIIHRDIKPENILIQDSNDLSSIKICDFGLSAQFNMDSLENQSSFNDYCGTRSFMAPELLEKKRYSKPVDIWSCGIVLYMIISGGEHPLMTKDDTAASYKKKLKEIEWVFTPEFNSFSKSLFLNLCRENPYDRYSAEQALQHPWITRNFSSPIPMTVPQKINTLSKTQSLIRIMKGMYMMCTKMGKIRGKFSQKYYSIIDEMNNQDQISSKAVYHSEILKALQKIKASNFAQDSTAYSTPVKTTEIPDSRIIKSENLRSSKIIMNSPKQDSIESMTEKFPSPISPKYEFNPDLSLKLNLDIGKKSKDENDHKILVPKHKTSRDFSSDESGNESKIGGIFLGSKAFFSNQNSNQGSNNGSQNGSSNNEIEELGISGNQKIKVRLFSAALKNDDKRKITKMSETGNQFFTMRQTKDREYKAIEPQKKVGMTRNLSLNLKSKPPLPKAPVTRGHIRTSTFDAQNKSEKELNETSRVAESTIDVLNSPPNSEMRKSLYNMRNDSQKLNSPRTQNIILQNSPVINSVKTHKKAASGTITKSNIPPSKFVVPQYPKKISKLPSLESSISDFKAKRDIKGIFYDEANTESIMESIDASTLSKRTPNAINLIRSNLEFATVGFQPQKTFTRSYFNNISLPKK